MSYPPQPPYPQGQPPNPPASSMLPIGFSLSPDSDDSDDSNSFSNPPKPEKNPGYPPQQDQVAPYPEQQNSNMKSYNQQFQETPSCPYPPPLQQPPMQGYPPAQPMQGYPPAQPMKGYPPAQPMQGYPPAQPMQGYPPPKPMQGYPPPQPMQGYPPPKDFQQSPIYPPAPCVRMQGTIRPTPNFNAQYDAKTLKSAMKGLGCKKQPIISVLCRRTSKERQLIALAFKSMYGKDLISALKSELRGNLENVCVALCYAPTVYDAKELNYAMDRPGTDEADLIEIMCTRSNREIMEIKKVYRTMYRTSLEQHLKSETSFNFKRLMVSMCTGARDESNQIDLNRAHNDANELVRAGVKKLGTDESAFMGILCVQNKAQLCALFMEYQKITKRDIEQDINKEFSGDIKKGLLAIVKCAKNTPAYFAERAHIAMAGMGTRDRDLIRVCVSRCEKDMMNIKSEYFRMYKKTLEQAIKSDTSGPYRDALITLIS